MLPIVRTFISLPAGVARMPFWRFTVLTTLGIPWIAMLTFIGIQAGSRRGEGRDGLHYIDYAAAAVLELGAAYLVVRWCRNGRTQPSSA